MALYTSIAHSEVEKGQDALKGTILVDSWYQNGYLGTQLRFSPAALLSLHGPMRVLFSISILALIALLWASIAIVRHVRQARRQHREPHKEPLEQDQGTPQR
jgi:hypothetical protein